MPWNCSVCDAYIAKTFQQLIRHIGRCHRNDPNFHCMCGIDGCTRTFRKYFSWRKHILRKHRQVNEVQDDVNPNNDVNQIENQDYDNNGQPLEPAEYESETKRLEALYILKLQEDCRLPVAAVDSALENTNSFVENKISSLQRDINLCLQNHGIDSKTVPGLENLLTEDNPNKRSFVGLETENKRKKYYSENFALKEPQRIVLGYREVQRRRGGMLKLVQVKDEAYYVPLLESLEQLLNDPSVLEEIYTPHNSTDGLLKDYCDGEIFKRHPLFSRFPTALQILMFYDDLEVCNPLGSKSSTHKLGAFYYTLGNLRPEYRSRLTSIQLLCLCKTTYLKKYGVNMVLEQFMKDLLKLEQDEGHNFVINGERTNFRGTIAYVSGDNLGLNFIGGFKESASAHRMCRQCMGSEADCKCKFLEKEFTLRTRESHDTNCEKVETHGDPFSKIYGINRKSILSQSLFYHVVNGLPPDAMHDILEGVLQYEVKEMLKAFIKVQRYFTLDFLNDRILKYDFGYYNDKNKPSVISDAKFASSDNSLKQNASQMWCLALHLPFLIGDVIAEDNELWQLFIKLLRIMAVCFSPAVTKDQLAYLEIQIEEHHKEFSRLYPDCSVIPKMHYMIHMPNVMLRLGPLVRSWCMRYEAKHHYFKKLATVIGNYTNLPYTLSTRHQQWICYKLQSTGNNESTFVDTGVNIGPGTNLYAGDLNDFELLKQELEWIERESTIIQLKWCSVNGTTYKVGCALWIKEEEGVPFFAMLIAIYVPERDTKNLVFLVHPLETKEFNAHLNAYEINIPVDPVPMVTRPKNLKYYLPLHVINPFNTGEQWQPRASYICPKYEYPSDE